MPALRIFSLDGNLPHSLRRGKVYPDALYFQVFWRSRLPYERVSLVETDPRLFKDYASRTVVFFPIKLKGTRVSIRPDERQVHLRNRRCSIVAEK